METIPFSYRTQPTHEGLERQSFYLPMRDGVRLAVDLYLPSSRQASEKLPTLLYMTRYWRAIEWRRGFAWLGAGSDAPWRFMTARGYAILAVDVRGTGASFGTRQHEWDKAEVQDGGDLAEWIVRQPWSNGCVGALGTSYSGTTAELLAVPNHPAVKAVLPRFNEFDPYTDIGFPGGLYLRGFVETWSRHTAAMDANRLLPSDNRPWWERLLLRWGVRGVMPTDDDPQRIVLHQAIAEHAGNQHAAALSADITYRDDHSAKVQPHEYAVYHYRDAIERSGVAIYAWGGWFDAVTADAVIRRWQTVQTPQTAIIGAWNHGASQHASPYNPQREDVTVHWHEFLRFFDHFLKGQTTGIEPEIAERRLTYFTLGAESWRTTTQFPPPDSHPQKWYCASDNALSLSLPDSDEYDDYAVDFSATTGRSNRWYTQSGGGAVVYADRANQDRRLLCYTSAPLESDLEICGYPVLVLQVAVNVPDCAFFAYLEAVEADGRVIYLSEGQLRGLHHAISDEPPPYAQPTPYHSFLRADGQALTPEQITEVRFGLLPISVLLRRGTRLRLALGGADEGLFPRLPAEGQVNWRVARSPHASSHIILPVIEQQGAP